MLIYGINHPDGKEVELSLIAVNLQFELIFHKGSLVGMITHYDRAVWLAIRNTSLFDDIFPELWKRTKTIYRVKPMDAIQERNLDLAWKWALGRLGAHMMGIVDGLEPPPTIVEIRDGGEIKIKNDSRLVPVVVKDYYNVDPQFDECQQDEHGDYYRLHKSSGF